LVHTRLPHSEPAYALGTAEKISIGLDAGSLGDPTFIKATIAAAVGGPIPVSVRCFDESIQPRMSLDDALWDGWLVELMCEGRQFLTPNVLELRRQQLNDAANELRPSLNANAMTVLDWMLAQIDGTDDRSQSQLAADIGITKGAITQYRDQIAQWLQVRCENRSY
jgi:hypothetical protein